MTEELGTGRWLRVGKGGSPSNDGAPVDRGTLEVTRWLERFE
jgi:hypothetical protein